MYIIEETTRHRRAYACSLTDSAAAEAADLLNPLPCLNFGAAGRRAEQRVSWHTSSAERFGALSGELHQGWNAGWFSRRMSFITTPLLKYSDEPRPRGYAALQSQVQHSVSSVLNETCHRPRRLRAAGSLLTRYVHMSAEVRSSLISSSPGLAQARHTGGRSFDSAVHVRCGAVSEPSPAVQAVNSPRVSGKSV